MFSNFHELPQPGLVQSPLALGLGEVLPPTLPLPSEDYQTYIAFLSQRCEEMTEESHPIYLVKKSFDYCLRELNGNELLFLAEKEDMYLHYVMYSSFKNYQLCDSEEFESLFNDMKEFYEATDDELLFIDRIEAIVGGSVSHQISPFSILKAYETVFSGKVQAKLMTMIKFIIGDSISYLLPPSQIFGLCLKWTVDRYSIKNQQIHKLISTLVNVESNETAQKLKQITQMMNDIINMEAE